MAVPSAPPPRADLTPDRMRQGITRIERCIAKVEAFDPQMIRTLHDTSKAEALSALVDSVLVQTFGEDTAEYRRYLGAKNFSWPLNYARPTPIHEIQESLGRSRARSLDLLRQAVSFLTQELELSGDEVRADSPKASPAEAAKWDVFVCHASEDKDDFVRPLARGLETHGLKVWFDEFTLTVGDSLRRSIDHGLAGSRFGVVVISPDFLHKEWPQRELDGLVAREIDGVKVILPVWHNITADLIRKYSPTLADRLAVSSGRGLEHVTAALLRAMRRG
jgi:hypothetical protein